MKHERTRFHVYGWTYGFRLGENPSQRRLLPTYIDTMNTRDEAERIAITQAPGFEKCTVETADGTVYTATAA